MPRRDTICRMKNFLMLLPVFFLALLAALVVCPFLFSLSQPEAFAAIAAGDAAAFFAKNLQNALVFMPTGIALGFAAVFAYIARRRLEGIESLLAFLALLALSVALLEPASVRLNLSLQAREAERPQHPALNEPRMGIIEERESGLKTVALQGSAGLIRPVLITADTSGMADGRGLNVYNGREAASSLSSKRASPLDLQIAQKLEEPAFLRSLARDIGAVNAILSESAVNSAGDYIWAGLSFFLLAGSFFFLCFLTDWKLVNFTVYAIAFRALYWLFPMLHGEEALGFLGRFLPRFLSDAALAALPMLLIAVALIAAGCSLILPQYIRRNQGGFFL